MLYTLDFVYVGGILWIHTTVPYSSIGRMSDTYTLRLLDDGQLSRFLRRKPKVELAF